jgi:hypothetical protein
VTVGYVNFAFPVDDGTSLQDQIVVLRRTVRGLHAWVDAGLWGVRRRCDDIDQRITTHRLIANDELTATRAIVAEAREQIDSDAAQGIWPIAIGALLTGAPEFWIHWSPVGWIAAGCFALMDLAFLRAAFWPRVGRARR